MIANGVAYAEFYKEQPVLADTLRTLMAARGLPTENQIGDQSSAFGRLGVCVADARLHAK